MPLPPLLPASSSGLWGVCFRIGGFGRGPAGAGRTGKEKVVCLLLFELDERLGLCLEGRAGGGGAIFGVEFAVVTRDPGPGYTDGPPDRPVDEPLPGPRSLRVGDRFGAL